MRGRGTTWGSALAAAAVAIALAGCTPSEPTPTPTEPAVVSPEPSASASATPPTLNLTGTAGENLAYFNAVNRAWITGGGATDGRSLIDNLVASGFPKSAMEVTPDRTTVNAEADQVMFSVRLNGTCLIGQYGGGRYNGTAQTLLSTGTCLVGTTRPIDW